MRFRVLAVGRDRKRTFGEAGIEYARRIARYLPFEVIELSASRRTEPERALAEEAETILAKHGEGRRLFALDVGGEAISSEEWARLIQRLMEDARDVDFVIGGDEGLGPAVRDRAQRRISLGPITLPHQLARVVLLEQIYRAMTILRGEPYHK